MDLKVHPSIDRPVRRVLLLCGGLCVMAFGVAFSIKAELGTSPISSVPYATAAISGLSVGTTTILMNFLFVLIRSAFCGAGTTGSSCCSSRRPLSLA